MAMFPAVIHEHFVQYVYCVNLVYLRRMVSLLRNMIKIRSGVFVFGTGLNSLGVSTV